MSLRSIILMSLICTLCSATETAVTQQPEHRSGTAIEIAVIISGIIAASTIAVLAVLLPTIIYYNYKKEEPGITVAIH